MHSQVTGVTGGVQDLLADDVSKGLFEQVKFIVTGDTDPVSVVDQTLAEQKKAT